MNTTAIDHIEWIFSVRYWEEIGSGGDLIKRRAQLEGAIRNAFPESPNPLNDDVAVHTERITPFPRSKA